MRTIQFEAGSLDGIARENSTAGAKYIVATISFFFFFFKGNRPTVWGKKYLKTA